jgi:hypothetical protein
VGRDVRFQPWLKQARLDGRPAQQRQQQRREARILAPDKHLPGTLEAIAHRAHELPLLVACQL